MGVLGQFWSLLKTGNTTLWTFCFLQQFVLSAAFPFHWTFLPNISYLLFAMPESCCPWKHSLISSSPLFLSAIHFGRVAQRITGNCSYHSLKLYPRGSSAAFLFQWIFKYLSKKSLSHCWVVYLSLYNSHPVTYVHRQINDHVYAHICNFCGEVITDIVQSLTVLIHMCIFQCSG